MEYKKINKGSYHIHLINTDLFKEVVVKVYLTKPLKKEDITVRNILTDVLTYSTKKYNTNKLLNIREQELYSSSVSSNNYRFGEYLTTVFSIDILNDSYTEEGNMLSAIKLLSEVMYNPNITNKRFDAKVVNIVKKDLKDYIEKIKENKSAYSSIRLFEHMDKSLVSSYRMSGYLEDLKDINPTNLYRHYKDMIDNSMMDIYVIGNINFATMENIISENFSSKVLKKRRKDYYLSEVKPPRKPHMIIETDDNNQSQLVIGSRIKKLSNYEEQYVLPIYNLILGGPTGDSMLFKVVREENSYAYFIYSNTNRLDREMIIKAGISKDSLKPVIKLITDVMNTIKKGKIADKDIKNAKEYIMSKLKSGEENPYAIINRYYRADIFGDDLTKEALEKIKKVTKKEVVLLAKKIKIDTIYCLEGDKSERD